MPDPTPHDLARFTKDAGADLGFDLVGITGPDSPRHTDTYEIWLRAGRHGEMHYLASERARQVRANPRRLLPGCRAIVVVGLNYGQPAVPDPGEPGEAGVATYAGGDDYHDVMAGRLHDLIGHLETYLDRPVNHRVYVDTGPLMERELAQRAGLGWIGKNTCLIHPARGSCFLLGEVLVDVDIEADEPFEADRCGSCTRCLQACPTECILPDRTLDASRCISYLTIELKEEIPADLRPPMGRWVFGCDICQRVCPWNERFAAPAADVSLAPRPFLAPPTIDGFLKLDRAGYVEQLRRSPLKRAKLAGLQRNACVAAGNAGDRRFVEQLIVALDDVSSLVRAHAAWALGRLGGSRATDALKARGHVERDSGVQDEIRAALSSVDAP